MLGLGRSKSGPPPARCKGTLLVNLRQYVQTSRDPATWQRIVEAAPPQDRLVLDQTMLGSSWYPVGVWNRALRTYFRGIGDVSAEMRRIARYVADQDLNTVLKFALSIATPDTIMARTGMFWSRYFDCGSLSPQMVKPREWVLVIRGPTEEDQGPSAYTCDDGVGGWVEQALTMAGAQAPRVMHRRCRFRGAPECEAVATW